MAQIIFLRNPPQCSIFWNYGEETYASATSVYAALFNNENNPSKNFPLSSTIPDEVISRQLITLKLLFLWHCPQPHAYFSHSSRQLSAQPKFMFLWKLPRSH